MGACASNDDEQLYIRHVFDKQGSPIAEDFAFTMIWYLPPEQLFSSRAQARQANINMLRQPSPSIGMSVDNETKLRLEDHAIARLERELDSHQMCPHGYNIENVKWLDRAIKFIGSCQSSQK